MGSGSGSGVPTGVPFQVGYRDAGQDYTLYLLAARDKDRAEWIDALRTGNFKKKRQLHKQILKYKHTKTN